MKVDMNVIITFSDEEVSFINYVISTVKNDKNLISDLELTPEQIAILESFNAQVDMIFDK